MSKEEIINILPTPEGEEFEKIKLSNPYNIMLSYTNAINEKYKGKISATITESSKIDNTDNLKTIICYSFYVNAPIGRGYLYRLFEVTSNNNSTYPVEVILFEKNPQNIGTAESPEKFNDLLIGIFKLGFTSTLILNLLAQVELFNEEKSKFS